MVFMYIRQSKTSLKSNGVCEMLILACRTEIFAALRNLPEKFGATVAKKQNFTSIQQLYTVSLRAIVVDIYLTEITNNLLIQAYFYLSHSLLRS